MKIKKKINMVSLYYLYYIHSIDNLLNKKLQYLLWEVRGQQPY